MVSGVFTVYSVTVCDKSHVHAALLYDHPPGLPHTWGCPLSVPEVPLAPLSLTWSPSAVGSGHASWPAISSWTCRLAPLPAPTAHPGAHSAGHALCPCRARHCQPAWEHSHWHHWGRSCVQLFASSLFMQELSKNYMCPATSKVYRKPCTQISMLQSPSPHLISYPLLVLLRSAVMQCRNEGPLCWEHRTMKCSDFNAGSRLEGLHALFTARDEPVQPSS